MPRSRLKRRWLSHRIPEKVRQGNRVAVVAATLVARRPRASELECCRPSVGARHQGRGYKSLRDLGQPIQYTGAAEVRIPKPRDAMPKRVADRHQQPVVRDLVVFQRPPHLESGSATYEYK